MIKYIGKIDRIFRPLSYLHYFFFKEIVETGSSIFVKIYVPGPCLQVLEVQEATF
jgi:hypothetical protein